MSVPAQEVRTEQPSASPVECGDRSPVNDRGPYLGMSLLEFLDGNRHRSQDIALPEAVDNEMPLASPRIRRPARQCFFTVKHFYGVLLFFLLHSNLSRDIFHLVEMKDRTVLLTASRKQLLQQMPDLSTVLPGSLLSRMVRCNKPGCRFCEKGKGKGHGPICILSVSLGNRQVRQVPIPSEMKKEVEGSLRAFAQVQKLLKQIAQVNLALLKERKRQRP
jgi:hypothetical protein